MIIHNYGHSIMVMHGIIMHEFIHGAAHCSRRHDIQFPITDTHLNNSLHDRVAVSRLPRAPRPPPRKRQRQRLQRRLLARRWRLRLLLRTGGATAGLAPVVAARRLGRRWLLLLVFSAAAGRGDWRVGV